jgi:hypothetical protein
LIGNDNVHGAFAGLQCMRAGFTPAPLSIMSCSVERYAHSVASVRAPLRCKPLETAD